jgi:hypothetical protein
VIKAQSGTAAIACCQSTPLGFPAPAVGDRARRRAPGISAVITGDNRHGRYFFRAFSNSWTETNKAPTAWETDLLTTNIGALTILSSRLFKKFELILERIFAVGTFDQLTQ